MKQRAWTRLACAAAILGTIGLASPRVAAAQSAATTTTTDGNPLRAFIDSLIDAPPFASAHIGVLIVDPDAGDTLYARNAGKLFLPASNMKLVTSSVALARLGPDYRYHTVFTTRGAIADGTLRGDLLVVGRGDPSVSDHMAVDAMRPLRAVADSLAARGIRRIDGRVLAAGDAFPGSSYGAGWAYDDFEDSYAAPIDELSFNEGFSDVHVRAGARAGTPVRATVTPAAGVPIVHVRARTVPQATPDSALRPLVVRHDSLTWDAILQGDIRAGDTTTLEIVHHDPDAAYVTALGNALRARGLTISGRTPPRRTSNTARLDTLATLTSPPLAEILKAMLKPSQNQIAEMVFRTIALEAFGTGRADSASVAVGAQLAAWGIAPADAIVRDGSGLSRYDFVTPRTLVRVLDTMRRAPTFGAFYDALPIAGVDGTLDNRMRGTPAAANVHAKTGSMSQVRTVSGYVTTADQHMLIFAILANNYSAPGADVSKLADTIIVRLAGARRP
jgi:D-alanyl-D-alanine carboxypeptidase/D-alanyl-D-alanine-endopeptidase (penicillin-binding protein 4)